MEQNPMYAELNRLKRERDALENALVCMLAPFRNMDNTQIALEHGVGSVITVRNARAALAQVRK